jgi:hypothetical protein
MESLIKELRLIRSKIELRALVLSELVPLQVASGVARSKRAKSQTFSDASSLATRVNGSDAISMIFTAPTCPLQTPSGGGPARTPDRSKNPAKGYSQVEKGIDNPRPVTEVPD